MSELSYDLVVVGGGPGGYVAAIRASQLGLKTALVERDKLGGRCLNYACIPAKAVLRSAEVLDEVRDSKRFGVISAEPELDWAAVGSNRDRVIKTLTGGVAGLLKKNKVEVFEGTGKLLKGAVELDSGQLLEGSKFILATGSVARPLPDVDFSDRVVDTAAAWRLQQLPQSLAVIGAGPSGVEIASAYARFGSKVTLYEMAEQVLPGEDEEVAELVARELGKQGIEVVTATTVEAVESGADSVKVNAAGAETEPDYLCIATGRSADTAALGLDELGVQLAESGLVEVDEKLSTSSEGVYAIGDLVAGPALAHKAMEEAVVAAEDAAGLDTTPLNHDQIPRATFCKPQVASFGLTEAAARQSYSKVTVGRMPFAASGAATVYGDRTGFVKIVGDAELGEIVGAQVVGPKACELIAELVVAKSLEAGFAELARTVHAHPTLTEAIQDAARGCDGWLIHG